MRTHTGSKRADGEFGGGSLCGAKLCRSQSHPLRQNYKHSVARGQISVRVAPHGLSVVVDPVFDGQTTKWKKVGFVVGDQCYAQCHGMRGDEPI